MGPEGVDGGRVAIYIRWSTEDQAAGTTLAVQGEACRHYVLSQGWRLRDDLRFVDDGWSGGSLGRPGIAELRRLVAAGQVSCVVVYKIDRLSRNLVDAVQLVLREWEGRCHLKSVREPIDTTTDLGRMIFGILAMFADFERTAIRDRTQAGKVQRIRDGQQMHARPAFGYAPHPSARGRWVAEPAEAALVREMFDLAGAGMAVGAIVRRLNAAGLRTRAGREWSLRSALWVLHNRTYLGEVVYGRTSLRAAPDGSGHRVRVRNAVPQVAGPTGAAPPLVAPDVFARAQAAVAARRSRRAAEGSRAQASPHLLTGLARCPCGAAMVFKAGARGRGGHYVCARTRRGMCDRRGHVPAAATEDLVGWCLLRRLGAGRAIPAAAVADALAPLRSERRALAGALAAARRAAGRRQREAATPAAPEAVERVAAERVAAERVAMERVAAEPVAAEPVAVEPMAVEPMAVERVVAERVVAERVVAERVAAEGARIGVMADRLADLDACLAAAPAALARMGAAGAWAALPPPERREVLREALAGPIILSRQPGGAVDIAIPWAL